MITSKQARRIAGDWASPRSEALRHLADQQDMLIKAIAECENALADYIPTIERTGASLNYGHGVLDRVRALLAQHQAAAINPGD